MRNLNAEKPNRCRSQLSREFKVEIAAQCLEFGASVSRTALDNGLNTNSFLRWISEGVTVL